MARVMLNHVSKRYGRSSPPVVKDFHLEIEDEEFMVLVGPSGCGKSTTLRMVAGLEQVSAGEIYIDNKMVNDIPPKKRDIAMVFQNYALYPNMDVFENMAFGLRLRKMEKSFLESMVKSTSRTLEIEHLLSRKPMQLSGGQRQRVALGRAIVRKPQVFLMDEPLSNLDAKLRVQMRAEIVDLHRRLGTTMIYVTHDQTEAMTMGTRICIMKDGYIQQVDTPENVYMRPVNMFVAGFIGSPPINFIHGKIIEQDGELKFDTKRFILSIPAQFGKALRQRNLIDRYVVLGIRPEYVTLSDSMERQEEHIKATVHFSELFGADRHLHLDLGIDEKVIMRVPAYVRIPEGAGIEISLNTEYMLFFNRDTGEAIG
ncbi:ABC transporter ATP-binding protein [Paenibacillus contaminans]|uniref:Sugar ABC transporter ATP-binding protein n=1 Tax=Paenibacillus contaminans TaxID=450362 RepID=A0A329MHX4_9BACL|nr:sn-glycerol-3-phosphate ABC transporter ATP-binding protein UgpC [Paenibacillus contaminans]RAV19188.1 sugar ABC transporter ATP-binding protein [Paenibacillus contaminans]